MSKVILTRIDSPEENEVNLSTGEVTIGRGSILKCDDKRISRNHGLLHVSDDGSITLVSMHTNPCFYKVKNLDSYAVLTKGQKKILTPGDEFSLLPNTFCYRVGLAKTDVENMMPGSAQTTPPSKRRRVLPGWLTDMSGNESPVLGTVAVSSASSPTATVSHKRKAASVMCVKTTIKEELSDEAGPIDQVGPGDAGPTDQVGTGDMAPTGQLTSGSVEPTDQVGPGSAEPTDQAGPGSAEPTDQVEPESAEPTDQVGLGSTGPTNQAGPASARPAKDGYEDVYGGTASRETCVYGATCYRKNPQHREEFSHPGDADFQVNSDLPECPYGTSCYRKNLQHRRDYSHTHSPPATPTAPVLTTSNVASCNVTVYSVCPKCQNTTCVDLTRDEL